MAETERDEVVTEVMLAAGAEAFSGYHPDFERLEDRLEEVYRAMRSAARHLASRCTEVARRPIQSERLLPR